MKKLLLMLIMMLATKIAFAEENFYCPSEIYCSVDHEINRLRCKTEKIEPDIWNEPIGNSTGTIRLSYVDFKRDFKGNPDGHACIYLKGAYGTVIYPKVEYNLVPDVKKESKWFEIKADNVKCGSYLSPVSSSKDCPFKIDSSLLLISTSEMHPVWVAINNTRVVEAHYAGKLYYPDEGHTSLTSRIEFSDVNMWCRNEKICKLDLIFKINGKNYQYKGGSIWVDMDNNMKIFDISQPKDSSFKIIKIGFNSVEIKTIK